MELIIREAKPSDAAALSLVGRATFLETFAGILDGKDILAHCAAQHSPEVYEAWLSDARSAIWLAETKQGGAPVAYAVLTKPDLPLADITASDLELKRIYALHRFHGTGAGRGLMEKTLERAAYRQASRVLLGVYAHNQRARAFYGKAGFVQVGERRFQVGNNRYEDVIFARTISRPGS